MKKLLAFAVIFVFYSFNAYSGPLEDGQALYDTGNYSLASQKYKMACDGRNFKACGFLGQMYVDGQGVSKNIQKGVSLFDKACKGNDGFACNNLGALYERGNGVNQDKQMALNLFNKACNLQSQNGCANAKTLTEAMKNQRQPDELDNITKRKIRKYFNRNSITYQ